MPRLPLISRSSVTFAVMLSSALLEEVASLTGVTDVIEVTAAVSESAARVSASAKP